MTSKWKKAKTTEENDLVETSMDDKETPNTNITANPATTRSLQTELNEAKVKHSQAVYWLQLELDTTRRAKQAVEDRMAELYRDVQELKNDNEFFNTRSRPVIPDAEYVAQQQKQIGKYERMLRIMNTQISLVQSSSDAIIKNLKDELSDVIDEKSKTEMDLLRKISSLDREKLELEEKLKEAEIAINTTSLSKKNNMTSPNYGNRPPQPPRRHKSIEDEDEQGRLLREDLRRLRHENAELKRQLRDQRPSPTHENDNEIDQDSQERAQQLTVDNKRLDTELALERERARENLLRWTQEKATLESLVTAHGRSNDNPDESLRTWLDEHRKAATASLDHVSLLWDRADESIRKLEAIMLEVRSSHHGDAEHLLTTLEASTLVEEQIKVSLMLIELKLRNNLGYLSDNQVAVGSDLAATESELRKITNKIEEEAVESIEKIAILVAEQIEGLQARSADESVRIRENQKSEAHQDMQKMLRTQSRLEDEVTRLQIERDANDTTEPNVAEMFVSQKALETLQAEILQVVEVVKEKNHTIGKLNAIIEEHKVRERSLMDELKRHLKDQADREMLEQQRIMQENARYHDSYEEENSSDSAFEEKTVEESIYAEETVYEEETVL